MNGVSSPPSFYTQAPVIKPGQHKNKQDHRILVYGAGVIGSLFAGKLSQAGYEVTLLARGGRLAELRDQGLRLMEDRSKRVEKIALHLADQLAPEDAYDLVLVIVRKNQLPSVLPSLAANRCTPNVLFLVNNAAGPEELINALGRERVILGFPGAGGQRAEGVVHYRFATGIQPTTIGELDGQNSERLKWIAQVFRDAGFPIVTSSQMDAWLKTHVALVSPIANALYLAGGSNYRLAHTRDGLVLLVRAIKEGFEVLRSLGIPITPAKYRGLAWLPEPLLVAVLRVGMATPQAELILARHANAARDEMQTVADEFQVLARLSGLKTPAIDALYAFMDPKQEPVPEGQANMPMEWKPLLAATAIVSAGILAGWLVRKQARR